MEEADSPHPSFLKRLRLKFSRRTITHPEDLEREIQHIIDEGEERGLITRQEGRLIESIFEFRDTLVREIMVPRLEMVGVEQDTPLDQIIALVLSCGHSRLPVFEGDIDHIKGILLAKDLLVFWQNPDASWDPERVLRPAYFIPESKKISDLLRDLVQILESEKAADIINVDLRPRLGAWAERLSFQGIELLKNGLDQAHRLQIRNVNQQAGLDDLAIEVLTRVPAYRHPKG